MATTVSTIIDPDGTGDYANSDLWEDAFGGSTSGDLVTDDEVVVGTAICTGGTADTTITTISGWTTDSDHTITFTVDIAYRHPGYWVDSGNVYRHKEVGNNSFFIAEPYTIVEGLAIQTKFNTNGVAAIRVRPYTGYGYVTDCLVDVGTNDSARTGCVGFYIEDTDDCYVANCVVFGAKGSGSSGFRFNDGPSGLFGYYLTAVDCEDGVEATKSATVLKNCVSFGNSGDAYNGTGLSASGTNNASDDGTAPGTDSVDISGAAAADLFVDAANNDYRAAAEGSNPLYNAGKDLSSDSDFPVSTDFEEVARNGTPTLGFDEPVVSRQIAGTEREQLHDKVSEWALAALFHPQAYYP